MKQDNTKFIGLDVHKKTMTIAVIGVLKVMDSSRHYRKHEIYDKMIYVVLILSMVEMRPIWQRNLNNSIAESSHVC